MFSLRHTYAHLYPVSRPVQDPATRCLLGRTGPSAPLRLLVRLLLRTASDSMSITYCLFVRMTSFSPIFPTVLRRYRYFRQSSSWHYSVKCRRHYDAHDRRVGDLSPLYTVNSEFFCHVLHSAHCSMPCEFKLVSISRSRTFLHSCVLNSAFLQCPLLQKYTVAHPVAFDVLNASIISCSWH